MNVSRAAVLSLLSGLMAIWPFADARADEDPPVLCYRGLCKAEVHRPPANGVGRSITPIKGNRSSAAEERRKAQAEIEAQIAAYERANSAWDSCVRGYLPSAATAVPCGDRPVSPDFGPATLTGTLGAGPPLITPGQAGAIAAARLKIPTVAPGIGPSPDLNRWKMAAVGYPLWLWADGPTQIGPVSDSVAGLSVSLRAEVTSLTFRMGDSTTVTCQGVGDKWTKAVEPGTKAPSCGHTYTKPSLPKGNYKVAALTEWAVTWTANGQSGVINVPAVQTAELPVGELQVLVR